MSSDFNFRFVFLVTSAFFSFVVVLFIDLMPAPLGGYADQRVFLAAISGLLLLSATTSGLIGTRRSAAGYFVAAFPAFLVCSFFVLSSTPYLAQQGSLIEPAMYAFFLLAVVASALVLVDSGLAESYCYYTVCIIVATIVLYGLSTINIYIFALLDGVEELSQFIPWGFVNIRYWSHIATWCLPLMPLALLVGPLKDNRLWRALVYLGAGLWWWILFLSTSRGSFLAILLGVTVVILLFGRRALPWLKLVLACALIGAVFWLVLSMIIPSFIVSEATVRSIKIDGSGRMPLFTEAWAMSLQNFPFGMGPQSWLTHEILTEEYRASPKFGHPHNMYLMWAAEYGWIMFAPIILLVAQAARYLHAAKRKAMADEGSDSLFLLMGFTAAVIAALVHAGLSAVFMAPGSMLVGLFVLIAFWGLIIPRRAVSKSEAYYVSCRRLPAALSLCCLVLLAWGWWLKGVWQYYEAMREDEAYYQEYVKESYLPRFWFHGNFPRHPDQMPPSN